MKSYRVVSSITHVLRAALLLSALLTIAVSPVLGASGPAVWSSRVFRTVDGLPSSVVNAITQDADGLLWVATDAGLARFDGAQFTPWGRYGEPMLPAVDVEAVLGASDGTLWVGLARGLCRIVRTTVTCEDAFARAYITALIEDRDHAVWVGTTRGLARHAAGQWEEYGPDRGVPAPVAVSAVVAGEDGSVWVASTAGVLRRLPGAQRFTTVSTEAAPSVLPFEGARFLVAEPSVGVKLVDPEVPSASRVVSHVHAVKLAKGPEGTTWVGTIDQGLQVTSRSQGAGGDLALHTVLSADETGETILSIFIDRAGAVWVGTRAGLFRLFTPVMRTISAASGLSRNLVRAVERGSDGTMWVATADAVHRFAPGRFDRPEAVHALPGRPIRSLLDDGHTLWVGTEAGLYRLEAGRFSPVTTSRPLNAVQRMVRGDDGTVWLTHDRGTSSSSLRDGVVTPVPGMSGRQCSALYRDPEGRIWFGLADGGVVTWDHGRVTEMASVDSALHGALDQQKQSNELLHRQMFAVRQLREQLESLLADARSQIDAVADSILVRHPYADDAMVFLAAHGPAAHSVAKMQVNLHGSQAGSVFLSRTTSIYSAQSASLAHEGRIDRKSGFQSKNILTKALLKFGSEAVGVVQFLNEDPQHPFTAADEARIDQICTKLALTVSAIVDDPANLVHLGIVLDPHITRATVVFTDITNSDALFQSLAVADATSLIDEYVERLGAIAVRHGARIDKFLGDGMMLSFERSGQDTGRTEQASAAVTAALAMQQEFQVLQQEWRRLYPVLESVHHRIGLASGPVYGRRMGVGQTSAFTIMGRPVNIAAHLCDQARGADSGVVVCESTADAVRQSLPEGWNLRPMAPTRHPAFALSRG